MALCNGLITQTTIFINPKRARFLKFVLKNCACSLAERAGNDQSFGVCVWFFSQRPKPDWALKKTKPQKLSSLNLNLTVIGKKGRFDHEFKKKYSNLMVICNFIHDDCYSMKKNLDNTIKLNHCISLIHYEKGFYRHPLE